MRRLIGWALLAAGICRGGVVASTAWTSLGLLAGSAITLAVIFAAYSRIGGWPGVAGWEFQGMQSPIVFTSVASTVALLVAPLLGLLGWGVVAAARNLGQADTATDRGAPVPPTPSQIAAADTPDAQALPRFGGLDAASEDRPATCDSPSPGDGHAGRAGRPALGH